MQDVATFATDVFVDDEITRQLRMHILAIRARPRYQYARIYVYIECNYGGYVMSTHLAKVLNDPTLGAIQIYGEVDGGIQKPGFWTTDDLKEAAVEVLRTALKFNMLHFADEYVCNTSREESISATLRQLSNFRRETKVDKFNPFQEPKEKLTGKKSGPDDHVICLAFSLEFGMRTRRNPRFITECTRRGWNTGHF